MKILIYLYSLEIVLFIYKNFFEIYIFDYIVNDDEKIEIKVYVVFINIYLIFINVIEYMII